MKRLLTHFTAIIITINLFAQAPQKMSYQAVIRNASNNLVTNAPVKMRISILQGNATGTSVYSELHSATTNANGLVSIEIGEGTNKTGTFSSINWGSGTYFLKTETDPNNGTNYTITGTSQLLSVPYALYAKSAESISGNIIENDPFFRTSTASKITSGDTTYWNNKLDSTSIVWQKRDSNIYFIGGNVGFGTNNPIARLNIIDTLTGLSNSTLRLNTFSDNQPTIKRGIAAIIYGTAGENRGIQGVSQGISAQENIGVIGFGLNATDNRGVFGQANSINTNPNGINYGVTGVANQSEFSNIAIGAYAEQGNTTNGDNYGVSARASSATSGINYGIYAVASNALVNYAGFFDGDVTITGTLANPSDRKLKSNIKQLNKAMSIIRQLKPVEYDYKKEFAGKKLNLPQNHQYGFVAQEIQAILPDLVSENKINLETIGNGKNNSIDGNLDANENKKQLSESFDFLGVNYISIIPILVQGLKEQDEKIKELESILIELKKQVEVLEKNKNFIQASTAE